MDPDDIDDDAESGSPKPELSDAEKRYRATDRRRRSDALDLIYNHKLPQTRVATRDDLCDFALSQLGDVPMTFLEFGVKSGRGLTRMTQRFSHPHAKFIGFDSFENMPQEWKHLQMGMFTTGSKSPKHRDPRVSYVKGWFQNTLPKFLAENDVAEAEPLFVHFDADLYGSTLFVLTQLWERAKDYYFIFDEFMQDEVVALYDFSRAYPVEFEFYAQTTTSTFKQVFGRMRRVEFKPPAKTG
ncbi:MAG TPA: TylF/MycF/NovP-related O-methyltransferase [Rhizomicrobium sp.]|nr:TylF/MycF/NovP-related O-methyltransferase [Rhizomicrobium sp.]